MHMSQTPVQCSGNSLTYSSLYAIAQQQTTSQATVLYVPTEYDSPPHTGVSPVSQKRPAGLQCYKTTSPTACSLPPAASDMAFSEQVLQQACGQEVYVFQMMQSFLALIESISIVYRKDYVYLLCTIECHLSSRQLNVLLFIGCNKPTILCVGEQLTRYYLQLNCSFDNESITHATYTPSKNAQI